MLNKKDNLIIFVLCLIVISLGVLIILKTSADIRIAKNTNISLNQNTNQVVNQNTNQNQNINQNINTNQQTKITIDGVDVSDWNVYENEEYGYSIKYPKDWNDREFPNTKTGADFTKDNNKIIINTGAGGGTHINDPFDEYIYSRLWNPKL